MRRAFPVLVLTAASLACGSHNPMTPPTPRPTPAETFTVEGTVFDDENHNGNFEGSETAWMPEVEVEIAGRVARSERRTGRVIVAGVPRGTHPVVVHASTLPPYYQPGPTLVVDVPQAAPFLFVPTTLPIGTNRPGVYLSSGDSISQGFGSSDGQGYRALLQTRLEDYFTRATLRYLGGGGGTTIDAVARINGDLASVRPAFTLLQWGVNDWQLAACQDDPLAAGCHLEANYRTLVRSVKAAQSLPCLATITPANVAAGAPPGRNLWVKTVNDMIRRIARDEGILLVDHEAAFTAQANLAPLFTDQVHPNDAGYALVADTYFRALSKGTLSR
jgi:lysophospholipase L1-like esterase